MKLILYSNPENGVLEKIEKDIFPKTMRIVFGYMPADGKNPKPQDTEYWQRMAQKHNAEFVYIDNSRNPNKGQLKEIMTITSLAIMGGNVFNLLFNLQKFGFDDVIKKLSKKSGFVYSGYGAGSIIVAPDIRIAAKEQGFSSRSDENNIGVKDTKGLGLIDFEILPHYDKKKDKEKLDEYCAKYKTKVVTITEAQVKVINIK